MTKHTTKEIDGIKFSVARFEAINAFKLKNKIIKMIAPALGSLVGSSKEGATTNMLDAQIDGESFVNALQHIVQFLDEDKFFPLVKQMFARTTATLPIGSEDGKNITEKVFSFANWDDAVFNVVFEGKLLTVYKLIGFVLEVNYPDFFGKMKGSGFLSKIGM